MMANTGTHVHERPGGSLPLCPARAVLCPGRRELLTSKACCAPRRATAERYAALVDEGSAPVGPTLRQRGGRAAQGGYKGQASVRRRLRQDGSTTGGGQIVDVWRNLRRCCRPSPKGPTCANLEKLRRYRGTGASGTPGTAATTGAAGWRSRLRSGAAMRFLADGQDLMETGRRRLPPLQTSKTERST